MTTDIAVPHIETTEDASMQVRRARQSLLLFACFLIPLSSFGYWVWVTFPDAPFILPTLAFSLSPGLASVLTRLVRREGFTDVSFRLRSPRIRSALLLALVFPLAIGTFAYGFAYLSGLAKFDPPPFPVAVNSPLGQFGVIMAFSIVGIVLLLIPDAGEEIGWRGYMLPRMVDARLPQPVLLSALIWGAWHLPVVFAGVYAVGPSRIITAVGLIVATLAFGSILAWLRLSTGSVWPCILLHAAWNSMINGGFTLATENASQNMWIGETGILIAVTLVIAALLLKRIWKPFQLLNDGGSHV
jgi:membrane protease YdiL (CAAX protease family)